MTDISMALEEGLNRDYLHSDRVGFDRCLGRSSGVNLRCCGSLSSIKEVKIASREDSSRGYLHSNRVGFGRCLGRGGNLCRLAEN